MRTRYIIYGVFIGLLIILGLLIATQAHAFQNHHDDNDHHHDYNQPTPTPTATPTPSCTPTPTITPIDECDSKDCEEDVTPTPTPTATPSARIVEEHHNDDPHASVEVPACQGSLNAPILQGFSRINDTTVSFNWWKSTDSVKHQWIEYGYSEFDLPYSVLNVDKDATSIELGALRPNTSVWARVCAYGENNCVVCSNRIDP